eukprot:GHVS01089543.1.p1 GENE.GHVS01089543.1~~GHVS01089543.1.p1  ORF type:complete len:161 (-),score=1.85 GHVS01089543.1:962-1444(-)
MLQNLRPKCQSDPVEDSDPNNDTRAALGPTSLLDTPPRLVIIQKNSPSKLRDSGVLGGFLAADEALCNRSGFAITLNHKPYTLRERFALIFTSSISGISEFFEGLSCTRRLAVVDNYTRIGPASRPQSDCLTGQFEGYDYVLSKAVSFINPDVELEYRRV